MRRVLLLILLSVLAGACRSPRYVPVPVTRTEVRHTVSRDSVFVRDSVSVTQRSSDMYWSMSDYLDVLKVLEGHSYVYFTSNKSSILELCEWIGSNKTIGNPFEGCAKREFNAHVNYNAGYTDMMLYKK